MAGKWIGCTVSDVAAPNRNAIVGGPFGSELVSRDYVTEGVPVIRGGNMGLGRWVAGEFAFVSTEKAESLAANLAAPGDLIFTQRGTLGQVAIVPHARYPRYLISQSQMKLTVDPAKASAMFLYYVFLSPEQQEYIRRNAIQTGVPHTNLGILRTTPLVLPSLSEQQAISHILGTLDDKIELNRRTNETLEAMARALFKSWFVDFDPVRAKAEGCQPTGMDAVTTKLFPSEFVDSELGLIPKGWRVARLAELTTKIGSGATPLGGEKAYVEEGTSFIRSQNIYDSRFVWDGLVRITDDDATRLAGVTVQRDDVLLNITGASILRTCVVDPEVLPARVNQHVAIVRPRPGIPSRYLHNHLLQSSTKSYLLGMDAGASRQAVTKAHIESVRIVEPEGAILAVWDGTVLPIFARIEHSTAECRSLERIRDALLPRLLSGELRVAEAERIAEAAA